MLTDEGGDLEGCMRGRLLPSCADIGRPPAAPYYRHVVLLVSSPLSFCAPSPDACIARRAPRHCHTSGVPRSLARAASRRAPRSAADLLALCPRHPSHVRVRWGGAEDIGSGLSRG